ncbi:MBL fold metallo-hydrolase [Sporolactobacillus putidus]|uniref:Zn-dependent hydrolase n=1 Tax=Sporolactobacillus putidus TaxID=492735 RepID=A0A917S3B9_9BACL|nr:MBL fold metallo-hydrolase [Sporolactobacillus putidus]GGL54720.1 Zn-dependent hydrolase [Sporolactobacillus putidus]
MLKKLTERVYYSPHDPRTDRPALGLICGDSYSLAVDAGNSPAHAKTFLQQIQGINKAPLTFVALTHWHWDHTFGLHTINVLSISQKETKKQLEYLKTLKWDDASIDSRVETGEEIAFCRDMIKREMPEREYLTLKSPDITFHDQLEIDLGGIHCVMKHVGGVHSNDASIVYVPEERVMFLGDCLCPDYYSGDWSYDREGLARLLAQIQDYPADDYVTSHNPPDKHGELWSYLKELMDSGERVGAETSLERVISKYKTEQREMPNEEQINDMKYFINGNRKKKRIMKTYPQEKQIND